MVNTDLRFKVTIDLSKIDVNGATNPNYRVITLEDTTNYSSLGVPLSQLSGVFLVKDPLNNIIHKGSFSSPDIIQQSSTIFDGVKVPLDSYNQPLNGEYTFQMTVREVYDDYTGDYREYGTPELKVEVCNSCTKGSVELTFDCNRGYAYGKDLTQYKSNASISRMLTLAPPVGAKYIDGSDASPFQTTSKNIQSNALWTQTWQLLLRSVFSENGTNGVLTYQILGSVEVRKDAQATCNINICSLFTCFDKKILELERKASRLGGITGSYIGEEMTQLTNAYMKLQGARECGDGVRAQKYYDALKDMLDCDCGCGNSNMPEYVYPLVPPPSDNTVVQGSQYISVTGNTVGNTTTYTVAISTALSNLIQLIKTYDVESGDDTIDVSKSVDGTSVLFDIRVNVEEVDFLLGEEIDSKGVGGDSITEIVQNLVDLADEGGNPPIAEPDIASTTVDTPVSVLVTANDFFSSNVVVTIKTAPNNGAATVGTDGKTITYTPDSAWTGTDVLTYTITDTQGRESDATLTVIVDAVAGQSCVTITAQFVASLSVQSGKIQVALTNLTNYLTNIPNSNDYVIEVRDASNNVLYTHNVVGNNNSIGQVFTIPETPDSTWNNIRVVQTVTSKNNVGVSCGTVTSSNNYTMPDVSSSIFAGVTVTCLGVTNADPDTVIMQALVSKACASITTVNTTNGVSGDGSVSSPVKLGGELTEDTGIGGDKSLTLSPNYFEVNKYDNSVGTPTSQFFDKALVNEIPGLGEGHFGHNRRTRIYFDDVTINTTTGNNMYTNINMVMALSGEDAVVNSPTNINGDITYGVANNFLGLEVRNDNVSIEFDRLINQWLEGIYGKHLQTGTILVNEYIQQFIRRQDAGTVGQYVLATNRYAIYQEGDDDDSYFAGEVTFNQAPVTPSDERSKEVLGGYEKGLEEIKNLNIVRFTRKEGFGNTSIENIGVIAQEVEPIIPEAVNTGYDIKSKIEDFKTLKTDVLMYTLINAVKELSAKVEFLESKLNESND